MNKILFIIGAKLNYRGSFIMKSNKKSNKNILFIK